MHSAFPNCPGSSQGEGVRLCDESMPNSPRSADGGRRARAHSLRVGTGLVVWIAFSVVLAGGAAAESMRPAGARKEVKAQLASQPLWLRTQSEPAATLAQPSLVKPGPLPYPVTNYPSIDAAIQQPQFVESGPQTESSTADHRKTDDEQQATAPPRLLSQIAPAAQPHPPGTENRIGGMARFWSLVRGPNQPSQPNQPQQMKKPTPARQASSATGNSLISQLLGTGSPPPRQVIKPAAPSPLANQLLLASAETELPSAPLEVQPSLRDIDEARTPATSMTISRPGLPPQPIAPFQSRPATAPGSTGMPPVPTVPTNRISGIAAALRRPFALTNDAPEAPLPDEQNPQLAAAGRDIESLAEEDRVPSLLRPFYATNPVARGGQSPDLGPARSESLSDALLKSSLGRQLAITNNENLRSPMMAAIAAEVKRDQEPWDGRVDVQWPLAANPFTLTNQSELPAVGMAGNVAQVAYADEELPAPGEAPAAKDAHDSDDDRSSSASDNQGKKDKDAPDTLTGAKTLGTAPVDNTLNFLRTETVLLKPGKSQFDIGLQYTLTENDFPILVSDGMGNIIGVDEVAFKGRELIVPMELRYGLLNRVQGFVQVPVGWSNVQAAIDNYDEYQNDGGIGDVGFGLTAQLQDAKKDRPYLIGTIAGLAPSGGDPFGVFGQISPNAPSLGNGFWAISGNLLWVQTRYDPVVVFYGFGARYQFEHRYIGIEFEPGTEYNYTLGAGFAVNERVTLSTQFFGAYIEELKANGDRVEGSAQEPMTVRLAATLAKPCNRIVEPFVAFGLTDDSISANFGITWTY